MYYISLLLPVLVALTTSADLKDEPPNIIAISALIGIEPEPDVLTEPQDYVITADIGNSPKAKNILRCRASNADEIKWQYRESDDGAWTDDLPTIMVPQGKRDVDIDTNTIELDISDGSTSRIEDLQTLNGYYRCIVENSKFGSQSQSAAVKLVVPYVQGTKPGPMTIAESPKHGESFSLSCFAQDGDGNGYRLVPEDAANFVRISYKWVYRVGPDTFDYPEDIVTDNPSRIKVDPVTGTLYWAYVLPGDEIPSVVSGDAIKLQCRVSVGSLDEIFTASDYADLKISTNTADISDPNVEILTPGYTTENGVKIAKEEEVPVCTSGQQCHIVAIFGGRAINEDSQVVGISTTDSNDRRTSTDNTGFQFTAPIGEEQVSYDCVLFDAGSATDLEKLRFNIKISNYPRLLDRTFFPEKPRLVQAGNDVRFECDAAHVTLNTKFFINGVQVSRGNPPYVTYNEAVDTEFQVKNAQRDNSFSVQCESKNEAGTLYTTSVLNVYDAPIVKQYPLEDIVRPANDNETYSYLLNCSFTLDIKTSAAKLYWRTDQEGLTGPITEENKDSDAGVSDIVIEAYDPATGIIASRLTLDINTKSQRVLPNTDWWCVVEYSVLDEQVDNVESEKINFSFEEVIPTTPLPQKFTQYPLVIGVAAGVIFLILLIVLINCYVQKNKGEQYYVDEKERKAGHNPEEEMEAYGFSDYTRPSPDYQYSSQTQIGYM